MSGKLVVRCWDYTFSWRSKAIFAHMVEAAMADSYIAWEMEMRLRHVFTLCLMVLCGDRTAGAPMPQVSTAGIGDAKFGMTVNAAEQALGHKLKFAKDISAAQFRTGLCVTASIVGIPGIELVFTKGQFDGLSIDMPTVTTKTGFKVGDSEAKVINRFQSDPTYKRNENRHEGPALMEITLGKSGSAHDTTLIFRSRKGVITNIMVGHVGYVYDPDYCAQ